MHLSLNTHTLTERKGDIKVKYGEHTVYYVLLKNFECPSSFQKVPKQSSRKLCDVLNSRLIIIIKSFPAVVQDRNLRKRHPAIDVAMFWLLNIFFFQI